VTAWIVVGVLIVAALGVRYAKAVARRRRSRRLVEGLTVGLEAMSVAIGQRLLPATLAATEAMRDLARTLATTERDYDAWPL
jgi:hypothetical protein